MNTINVPFLQTNYSLPCYCLVNCERQVEEKGGEVVLGWDVSPYPRDDPNPVISQLIHHVCWRDAEGQLWNLTPQLADETGQLNFFKIIRECQFLPDPEAKFIGEKPNRQSLPSRFVPLKADPLVEQACNFYERGNDMLQHCVKTDNSKGNYCFKKATEFMNRYYKSVKSPGRLIFVPMEDRIKPTA